MVSWCTRNCFLAWFHMYLRFWVRIFGSVGSTKLRERFTSSYILLLYKFWWVHHISEIILGPFLNFCDIILIRIFLLTSGTGIKKHLLEFRSMPKKIKIKLLIRPASITFSFIKQRFVNFYVYWATIIINTSNGVIKIYTMNRYIITKQFTPFRCSIFSYLCFSTNIALKIAFSQ